MTTVSPEQTADVTRLAELLHRRDDMPRHVAIVEAERRIQGGAVEVRVVKTEATETK